MCNFILDIFAKVNEEDLKDEKTVYRFNYRDQLTVERFDDDYGRYDYGGYSFVVTDWNGKTYVTEFIYSFRVLSLVVNMFKDMEGYDADYTSSISAEVIMK